MYPYQKFYPFTWQNNENWEIFALSCMGTPPSFSTMFSKGDNFCNLLFADMEDKVFPT